MRNLINQESFPEKLIANKNPGIECANFFSMHKVPFTLAPKKENIYEHKSFLHVKNTLLFGISSGEKLLQITGETGSGKTLLINDVLSSIDHHHYPIKILNPKISPKDLLSQIIDEFGRPYPMDATIEQLMRLLRFTLFDHYTKTDANILVWIDDAQLLSKNTLIIIEKVSSWSTPNRTLLQFILSGSNALNETLKQQALSSLKNNIRFSDTLNNLEKSEIQDYVKSCIQAIDKNDAPQFTPKALSVLYKKSGGNPSRVNILAYKALLFAYGKGRRTITHQYVNHAFKECEVKTRKYGNKWLMAVGIAACANIVIGIVLFEGFL